MKAENIILIEIVTIIMMFEFLIFESNYNKKNSGYLTFKGRNNLQNIVASNNNTNKKLPIILLPLGEKILNDEWHKVTRPYSTKKDLYVIK